MLVLVACLLQAAVVLLLELLGHALVAVQTFSSVMHRWLLQLGMLRRKSTMLVAACRRWVTALPAVCRHVGTAVLVGMITRLVWLLVGVRVVALWG